MFNPKWEVIEQDEVAGWNVKVWLINRNSPRVELARVNKDGMLEMVELKEGTMPEPTLNLNRDAWMSLKQTMIDKKVEDVKETTSELKATKYHLEDMRKLLKLK